MILQLLVALACLGAGVLQLLATLPHVGERTILRVARRITGVSLLLGGSYVVYTAFEGGANPVYCWVLGLFALGQFLFSMNTFMDPVKTEVIIRSATQKVNVRETSHA